MSPFFYEIKVFFVALIRQNKKTPIYREKIKLGGENEFPKN